MNQEELQNLIDYIERRKQHASINFSEAKEKMVQYYWFGYKEACMLIQEYLNLMKE